MNEFYLVTSIWIGQQGWFMTMPGRGWMDGWIGNEMFAERNDATIRSSYLQSPNPRQPSPPRPQM